MSGNEDSKIIIINNPASGESKKKSEKITVRKIRKISLENKWNLSIDFNEQDSDFKLGVLQGLLLDIDVNLLSISGSVHLLISSQIGQKIYGYKSQDMHKNIFLFEEFVNKKYVLELLLESRLLCYYCKKGVELLYSNVREPMQWSLDRIDNNIGHNIGNVCIACLGCNLRRKTINQTRYLTSKQFIFTKTA
jgi:hypothetical protein